MIWTIRRFDPGRLSIVDKLFHEITRTELKPKTRLAIRIERSSCWIGLFMGFVMVGLGLIFANME